ncbi:hypothetical protein [Moraxella oculi]|uniref:Uncharacterized protein n=1 Tax=Moraxella oculi TaxID=2940516 RepID=A0ABW8U4S5_9GAMM
MAVQLYSQSRQRVANQALLNRSHADRQPCHEYSSGVPKNTNAVNLL